ncbi:MAG TPA: type II secretion system F family protein, partial [Thermoleophilia bacterium]|nr:type II secretion system F family protein [Thermoleophilia bacterium]
RDRGGQFTGQLTGESKAAVVAELRRKGFTVLRLEEKRGLPDIGQLLEATKRIKTRDKAVFARQFATMINSGLAVLRALHVLETQTQNPKLRDIVRAVREDVEAGMPLSDAMAKHPAAFDRLYVAMVRAGEAGGALDQTLNRLATQLEKDDSLRRSIKSAMAYPVLIAAFAIMVMIGMLLFIIPIFANMYKDLGGQLPSLTRMMMGVSNVLKGYWFIVFPVLILLVWLMIRMKNTEQGRRGWDRMKLKLPMKLGPVVQKIAIARFSRTLATLVSSGVPILQAIEITGKTSGNSVLEESMVDVKESVRSGESIAKPLSRVPVFPPMVTHMISIGEETGALDSMLNKIADFYEDEVDAAIKSLTSIIEPIMMMFVGGMVGLIVISMYLPMFNMMNLVK